MPVVISGGVEESGNRGAVDWGPAGLVAFAAHSSVVVADPGTAAVLQTLQGHKASVTRVHISLFPVRLTIERVA